MAVLDSTVLAAIAASAGTVASAVLVRTRKPRPSVDVGSVSLTKQLLAQQRSDTLHRIRDLERETRELRSERNAACVERDALRHELDFLRQHPPGA